MELENGMTMENLAVATGENFPDALAGAALCGSNNSVLLLAEDSTSTGIATIVENKSSIKCGYVLGGAGAISDDLLNYLKENTQS
jgi:lactocepin